MTAIDIGVRDQEANGMIEIIVWKRERQGNVPVPGTGLPPTATVLTSGMQMAFRSEMPGRVYKYIKRAIAPEQPANIHIDQKWYKFKVSTIRQGDFYGVSIFNRNTTSAVIIDIETRYKEHI